MQVILCSKDRPAQLDLSIRSLLKHGPGYKYATVIYKGSAPEYTEGYDILKETYEDILFIEEVDFRKDVLNLENPVPYTMFMMDDDIFYRKSVSLEKIKECFSTFPLSCYSLRLGENTMRQNPHNESERVQVPSFSKYDETLIWDHNSVALNFGYPLSLDCHVFRTDMIFSMMKQIEFKTPNFLEANLQQFKSTTPRWCACSKTSSVFGNPVNRVQDDFQNGAGEYCGVSTEDLNRKFLEGNRLELEIQNKIVGAHQEVELKWQR